MLAHLLVGLAGLHALAALVHHFVFHDWTLSACFRLAILKSDAAVCINNRKIVANRIVGSDWSNESTEDESRKFDCA